MKGFGADSASKVGKFELKIEPTKQIESCREYTDEEIKNFFENGQSMPKEDWEKMKMDLLFRQFIYPVWNSDQVHMMTKLPTNPEGENEDA